jgi:hypothetical protein
MTRKGGTAMGEPIQPDANGVPDHAGEVRRLEEGVSELGQENERLRQELATARQKLEEQRLTIASLTDWDGPTTEEEWRAALATAVQMEDFIRELEENLRKTP